MIPTTALSLALLLPLCGIVLTFLFDNRPNVREAATIIIGTLMFWTIWQIAPTVFVGERPELTLLTIMPGLSVAFLVEPLGLLFALIASGLWVVTTCYAIGYMRGHNEKNQTRFFACFAAAIFAAAGAAFAKNMFTLFLFYEFMTLSTYPLVTHHGTDKAKKGGRVYLSLLLGTSILFLLPAMIWTWVVAGTLDFTPGGVFSRIPDKGFFVCLFALYAFGTGKAALMPFHRWLPSAMVAPTPVSALLHAVAVVKVGVFTVLKVVIYIFGVKELFLSGAGTFIMYVAAATILIASLIAMTKDNLKERLAYSTISQLSYIVLGAALATQMSVIGGGMHIAMHAFGKITLFFCAGAIYVAAHKTEISDMEGIGRKMPITLFAFFLGTISIIGLPPFGGSWSKWFLAMGAADANHYILIAVFMISSLLNIAYLMPIVVRGFLFPPKTESTDTKIKEAPIFCLVPICFTAVAGLMLFLYADSIYEMLKPLVPDTNLFLVEK